MGSIVQEGQMTRVRGRKKAITVAKTNRRLRGNFAFVAGEKSPRAGRGRIRIQAAIIGGLIIIRERYEAMVDGCLSVLALIAIKKRSAVRFHAFPDVFRRQLPAATRNRNFYFGVRTRTDGISRLKRNYTWLTMSSYLATWMQQFLL